MPLIIGTAGHIDHGKTSLVAALTGEDTDRLAEEKARGISIDLGFAHWDAPDGERAGVVDVPGHERFVRNMLAGAHGMDLVLFTVAADDGVMPQTEEHLDILHLLGVERGIWVITKADLADAARLAAVREEIEILACGTTLEGAPIVAVSSRTGAGLDGLRAEMARQLARPAPPAPSAWFRLPVDRAFTVHGHGLVVTGTATSGGVAADDVVRILPGGETARVRSVEVHGTSTRRATRGQRVALNLGGVARADVRRGHVVCDPRLEHVTARFDAVVEVRPGARRALKHHGRVRLHLGTAEVLAKVVLLEQATTLPPRARGWVQLACAEPVVALRGDRFVLRDETARWTLGGGVVVNPFADRHRRGDATVLPLLDCLRGTDDVAAAAAFVDGAAAFASAVVTVAQALNRTPDDVAAALAKAPGLLAIPDARTAEAWTSTAKWARFEERAGAVVAAHHAAEPLAPGLDLETLRAGMPWPMGARVFRWAIDRLVAARQLARTDGVVHLPTHRVALDAEARRLGEGVERVLVAGGLTPPDLRQLEETTHIPRARLGEVLRVLEREGRVVRVSPDLFYAAAAADEARARLVAHCRAHGEITAAVFRDLIGGSRKFAIAFLDWTDRTGFTVRVGDVRRLRRPA
jgi:selenocysteine-specific elongation factor